MSRYFFYLILLNMLVNVFAFVPSILFQNQLKGTVMAIPLAVLIGCTLLYMFTKSLNRFGPSSLSDMLQSTPALFKKGFLILIALMWYFAGAINLLAFNNVTIRFINPDVAGLNMITLFALLVILIISQLRSIKILYLLEILLLINIPLIMLLIYQAYSNKYMSWSSVVEFSNHFAEIPNWETISAATYIFSGYLNMIVFYKAFDTKLNMKLLWVIPFLGLANLITTTVIPIGLHGLDGVTDLTYPWVTTADSIRIEFGPIERVISFFLLLYVSISMISVIVHWHVAYELIKSAMPAKYFAKRGNLVFRYTTLSVFVMGIELLEINLLEPEIFELGRWWLSVRFPFEILLVVLLFILARKKAKTNGV